MITLRPDQADIEARIYNSWNAGHRNVLAVAPTGWGKSVLISEVALKKHLSGSVQIKIAHRNELVGQLAMHIARRGIKHRIIASASTVRAITNDQRREFGKSFVNPDANCAIAGVDTLNARADMLKEWAKQVDHWTIDEAHHCVGNEKRTANKWGRAIAMFPNAVGLGVTASPRRADGVGLGRWQSNGTDGDGPFHDMVVALKMRELIDIGALSDYQIVVPESDFEIDEADIAPGGDWSTARMREASRKSHIVGDVVENYVRWAYGKQAICFATDVETSNEIAENFNRVGISAASVSAKTPTDVRNEYIRRFRDGRLTVLVNVDLFGEGFDVPAVEVVIMARPTASLAVFLQQFGRALRIMAGKAFGLVIDHVSNWKRHGLPDKEHYWSLDRRDKRSKREPDPEEIKLTVCRECSRPYDECLTACPYCGAVPPLPMGGGRSVELVAGDLMLLDIDALARLRASTLLEAPADAAARAGAVAGAGAHAGALNRSIERHQSQARLKGLIAAWAGVQRYKGRDDRQTHKRFYFATGVDVLTALALPRADMDKIANQIEGWL